MDGELNNRLEKIKYIMYDNGLMAQAKAKQQHDKKTQVRQINEGDMVLLRSPGMLGKLDTQPGRVLLKFLEKLAELMLNLDFLEEPERRNELFMSTILSHTNKLKLKY